MKRSRFIAVLFAVIAALLLLVTVATVWSVLNYRDMRCGYQQQIDSILNESMHLYISDLYSSSDSFTIGDIERFEYIAEEKLRSAGLATHFRVEVILDSHIGDIVLMSAGHDNLGSEPIVSCRTISPITLKLHTEDPHRHIIEAMMWIMALQALAIVAIIVAFVYLLVTLFRAKEVDRIRRELTHNITHELKTPIAAAHAATEALRTIPTIAESDSTRNDYLDITLGELRRLDNMVEEILRSATEEFTTAKLRPEKCDVRGVVEEVCSSIKMRYAQLDVEWSIEIDDDCSVVADSFHLMGAISAIVDNAIKYSAHEPKVSICATTREGYTYISIEDNGIGIAKGEQKRIFDKFYRITHGDSYTTSGYGVGLYYALNVARHHGGDITLRSTVGRGSCFTIKLPRYGR